MAMLDKINRHDILFLDIETVSQHAAYEQLPENAQKLWDHKAERLRDNDNETPAQAYERAGIYAEFGKIVCISAGFFNGAMFRLKSFWGHDEKQLLLEFANLLVKFYTHRNRLLCAHNGKEFDFPYIARRLLINGIRLPEIISYYGKKPWEVPHLDTMELWRFGDYKNYTSLELLAHIFGIPTPKDDIKGSDVGRIYWQENDLERIVRYCEKDVITIARLFLSYSGEAIFDDSRVEIV
jgi:3'-5' exonuclease